MTFLQKKNTSSRSEIDSAPEAETIDNPLAVDIDTVNTVRKQDPHAKKGHATPSRKQSTGKRPVHNGPPPMTRAEARKRKKTLRPNTRAEKKAANAQRRARMMAGDEAVLPIKDRGPIRRFARSAIDSRRSVSNYLLPILFLSILVSLIFSKQPQYMIYCNFIFMALLFVLILDAAIASWIMIKKTRQQFPHEKFNMRSLFFYGFLRSTQLRKMRMPAPSPQTQFKTVPQNKKQLKKS